MKNVVVRKGLWIVGLLLVLGLTVAAQGFGRTEERADCPGKVLCPLTGEEVCKDRCPLVDANRADCPGKIECPVTGELVCRDECPLVVANDTTNSDEEVPSCCRGKE